MSERHVIRLEGREELAGHRANQRNLIRRSLKELLDGIGQEFDFRGHKFVIEMEHDGVTVTAERVPAHWESRPVENVSLPSPEPAYYGD